jgi:2-amino-4-hydroxy-6-hydroxymethyldihydropteridine diphosphokinase
VKTVYLSLGSNIGNREANLRAAIEGLSAAGIRPVRTSPIYETEPVETRSKAWFLNLVVEAETSLFPLQLLLRALRVERDLKRVRMTPKGPRTIDIDILLYGNVVMKTVQLEIPHPRMAERRFVLAPLADLVPALRHPVMHRTVKEMLESAPPQIVRKL